MRNTHGAFDRCLPRLQPGDAECEGHSAGCGFVSVTPRNRNDETACLFADRDSRIGSKQIRDNGIACIQEACIEGAGKFGAGVSFRRYVIQTHGDNRHLADIDARGGHNGRNGRCRTDHLAQREKIKSSARLRLDLNEVRASRLGCNKGSSSTR